MNYNMNETMAFTGHRLIAPSKAGQIRQNVRKQIKDLYIGGKTKCVKMNETLNQWKAL